ncbi:MAG: threonine--tRNA ligase [Christensenellales bacterium]|jgi:threonyl-tRNA synthetase
MRIRLADGTTTEFEDGMNGLQIAKSLSQGLAKNALAVAIDGETQDLMKPIRRDAGIRFLMFEDEEGRHALRHTASHVLAQAVKNLYPDAKLAIGPAIDNGYYYDFDVDMPFSTEDLAQIEKEMNRIIKKNDKLERFELPREEAIQYMKELKEPYKVELIEDLPRDAVISFYRQGDFVDLCAGPHVPSTGKVKKIKLTSVAGAYWRGNEKNKMLQRIYGTAFEKKEDLDEYLRRIEEAKKRDHRKLGRELDLFSLQEEGPGFPFFHPKGMILRNCIEEYWREEHQKAGYKEIRTPIILNKELWVRSGHWDHYQENMYFTKIDDADFAIKPMNCPGSMIMFKRRIYSYRDLPERLAELGLVHRHEVSGALHGLMRVRNFTQDDAHIFMTRGQVRGEIEKVIELTQRFYDVFGFKYSIELSTRPDDSMGSDEDWAEATNALEEALKGKNLPYRVNEGDGAFYGPKIDFHLEDSIGRTWQCGTIQLDFQMPERFDLHYAGEDGQKHRPVMIHRVVLGSVERFIAVLTEHFAGAFPLWMAPVQVKVMSITDRTKEKAQEVDARLKEAGLRSELDLRNEKIGFKIREAQMDKIPYMIILGDKELQEDVLAVRARSKGDMGTMPLSAFIEMADHEIQMKTK